MGKGAWWATVHGVAKSRTQLSDFTLEYILMSDKANFFSLLLYYKISLTFFQDKLRLNSLVRIYRVITFRRMSISTLLCFTLPSPFHCSGKYPQWFPGTCTTLGPQDHRCQRRDGHIKIRDTWSRNSAKISHRWKSTKEDKYKEVQY